MNITFSPIRADWSLSLERKGDTVIVNGEDYDFAGVPDGAVLPKSAVAGAWLAEDVRREDGQLQIAVLLPIGASAPEAARFPEPLTGVPDGVIALPAGVNKAMEHQQ